VVPAQRPGSPPQPGMRVCHPHQPHLCCSFSSSVRDLGSYHAFQGIPTTPVVATPGVDSVLKLVHLSVVRLVPLPRNVPVPPVAVVAWDLSELRIQATNHLRFVPSTQRKTSRSQRLSCTLGHSAATLRGCILSSDRFLPHRSAPHRSSPLPSCALRPIPPIGPPLDPRLTASRCISPVPQVP